MVASSPASLHFSDVIAVLLSIEKVFKTLDSGCVQHSVTNLTTLLIDLVKFRT